MFIPTTELGICRQPDSTSVPQGSKVAEGKVTSPWGVVVSHGCPSPLQQRSLAGFSLHFLSPLQLVLPFSSVSFYFLPQDRIVSHMSKTSKMAFQLLVFIDSLNFPKDHAGPFSLIMKTRGQ